MTNAWRTVGRACVRGSAASVASTVALVLLSWRENGSPLAGLNAVSHWLWGDADARRDDFTARHTLVGATTQHAASIFWALVHERLFGPRPASPSRMCAEAVATTALAGIVDYTVTPKRLTPGYELELSTPSIVGVYVAFAVGLAAGSFALAQRSR